ncbi:hypothetical protein K435DRAFT_670673, partial [Dendrothele bispora CBS 962.96]
SKNKTECGDIANALGIVTNGVLANMRDQILQHFDANPDLKTNPRYVGLFQRGCKRKIDENEHVNIEPERSSQRRCLEDVSNNLAPLSSIPQNSSVPASASSVTYPCFPPSGAVTYSSIPYSSAPYSHPYSYHISTMQSQPSSSRLTLEYFNE